METKEMTKEELVKKNMSEDHVELLFDLNESNCSGINMMVEDLEYAIHFFLTHFESFENEGLGTGEKITKILVRLSHIKDVYLRLKMPELDLE